MKTLLFLAIILVTTHYITQAFAGTTVVIKSADVFGFFLPPGQNQIIGDHEQDGIAFMTTSDSAAPGSNIFPGNFIETHNYLEDNQKGYVQVTGKFNNSIYVNLNDSGGQYDHNHSPEG